MKRYNFVLTLFFALLIGAAVAPNANAQRINAGLLFGSDTDLGLLVGTYFDVTETIDAGGDFRYFLPDGYDYLEVNINGRYPIPLDSGPSLFVVAGLNYARYSFDTPDIGFGFGGFDASGSDIGLNVGAMAEFGSDEGLGFFADAKIVLGGGEQFEVGGGVSIAL